MGSIFTAFIFGNMAALMATLNKKENSFQEQMDLVQSTMRSIKLPEKMRDDVTKYLQYIHSNPDIQQDLEKFFSLLSPAIKGQILFHIHSITIEKVDILSVCSDIEISFIVKSLKTSLYLPNDLIVRQGEEGDCLFLINRGNVEVQMNKYETPLKSEYKIAQPMND